MVKYFTLEEKSNWGNESQELLDEKGNLIYDVYDLTDCPEDATIHRCLFSAYDYIEAVKYGMELAKEGYTDIFCGTEEEINKKKEEDELKEIDELDDMFVEL